MALGDLRSSRQTPRAGQADNCGGAKQWPYQLRRSFGRASSRCSTPGGDLITVLPNKEMQLTRPVQNAASQLISSVGRASWRGMR